ncbi:MFS transporter [Actinophytocola algeriensis]|uniref:MFS family permease n=1 Tax=Actinophytocola algeriensis TaxID=1768010 RepID=A0A7W7Q5C5_9PSEU|nr:MFS transporter [Actinophytocola algeriensis]MBB4907128.1 MFS family permease [Actinophytocola algeriensis]MBE1478611.1 MFS family permease [Actinophytocola algeriensis]
MQFYRRTLALPGVRTLLVLVFFARIPGTAAGMALTLHIAVTMDRGYGAAGTVGAVATIGIALGAPVLGRVVDRYGLRPMLVVTTIGEATFWVFARFMSYPMLLVCGFVGGLLVLPAMSIGRQAIAALVPEDLRRTAYSMDSVSTELSFMVGPAAAVLVSTQFSTQTALMAMAVGIVVVGCALYVVNPAVRSKAEKAAVEKVPRRVWLTPRLVGVLLVGAGAVFILAGTEVAIVAQMQHSGELSWTGVVVIVWSAGSAVGGLVYGALTRSYRQATLMAWLGVLTIPIGLAGGEWWWLMLALVPAAFLCAPTIAATGEEVARLAPPAARGEATGLQSSAFTLGAAAGAPLVGFVVDHASPGWGFAIAGIGGVLVAGLAWVLAARQKEEAPIVVSPDTVAAKH